MKPLELVFRVSPKHDDKEEEIVDVEEVVSRDLIPLPSEPSYQYARRTWWDDLLSFYSPDRAIACVFFPFWR